MKKDPIEKLTRKEAVSKLKAIRDIIWPHSAMANGERDIHHISAYQVYDEIKELFEPSLRMLPTYDDILDMKFYRKRIERR